LLKTRKPDRLYASFEIQADQAAAPEPLVTIRALQDFNCDGVFGVNESKLYVNRTTHLLRRVSFHSTEHLTE
jgi:hypothetical protein